MLLSKKFVSATPAGDYATFKNPVPAPYMRRNFVLEKLPQKAEITVCGLGFYKLFINGQDITKGILAPYISNSDQTVYFDKYNIVKYLVKGKNTAAFILGNGFQNCVGGGVWDLDDGLYRTAPKLAFAIELEQDGEKTLIEADKSVLTHDSPITFNDIRCGVHYDARLETDGWNIPGYDDSNWKPAVEVEAPKGEYMLCTADPVVVYKQLKPVSIKKDVKLNYYGRRSDVLPGTETFYDSSADDSASGYEYDFGEDNAGLIKLKIKGKKGQRIVLQLYERHNRITGLPDFTNLHFFPEGFVQRDIYICRGEGEGEEEEIFIPDFTYHGFRYCWVTGITEDQAKEDLITYLVASSDLKQRCEFKCSDDITNKLWEASLRSDLSNFYYFPTDCPHREKNGWTGDASVSTEHMVMKLSVENSYKAWLASIRNAQRCDGAIPGIVPTGGWGFAWGNGPIWDSVIFSLPFYVYMYRGDTDIISENAVMMMRYLDYISKKRDEKGLIHIGLGDWCPVGKDAGDYDVPLEFTDSAATMDSARKAAIMFHAVGLENQAEFAENLYYEMRQAIRENLIDFNTMTVLGSCQSGQAIALALGVFDPAERSEAYTRLIEFIEEREDHFDTGFYGARYIFHVLTDFGDADLAYRMITRTDYPSYGNWIARGATTLWESFFDENSDGSSLNHHFWGDISSWYMKTILGLRVNPDLDDISHINLSPNFIEALDSAEGYYDSPCGRISVKWQREGGDVKLSVNCPDKIHGVIKLPFGFKVNDKYVLALHTGEYTAVKNY